MLYQDALEFVMYVLKDPYVSWIGGGAIGFAFGVASSYYADKYTDRRRMTEHKKLVVKARDAGTYRRDKGRFGNSSYKTRISYPRSHCVL